MYGSIEELNKSLSRWRQVDGPKMVLNSLGEKYTSFGWSFPARESDVPILKVKACANLSEDIERMLWRYPPDEYAIEWRKRPECIVSDYPLVIEYRPDGPDKDFVSDRSCVMDHDFKLVQTYARISFVPIAD